MNISKKWFMVGLLVTAPAFVLRSMDSGAPLANQQPAMTREEAEALVLEAVALCQRGDCAAQNEGLLLLERALGEFYQRFTARAVDVEWFLETVKFCLELTRGPIGSDVQVGMHETRWDLVAAVFRDITVLSAEVGIATRLEAIVPAMEDSLAAQLDWIGTKNDNEGSCVSAMLSIWAFALDAACNVVSERRKDRLLTVALAQGLRGWRRVLCTKLVRAVDLFAIDDTAVLGALVRLLLAELRVFALLDTAVVMPPPASEDMFAVDLSSGFAVGSEMYKKQELLLAVEVLCADLESFFAVASLQDYVLFNLYSLRALLATLLARLTPFIAGTALEARGRRLAARLADVRQLPAPSSASTTAAPTSSASASVVPTASSLLSQAPASSVSSVGSSVSQPQVDLPVPPVQAAPASWLISAPPPPPLPSAVAGKPMPAQPTNSLVPPALVSLANQPLSAAPPRSVGSVVQSLASVALPHWLTSVPPMAPLSGVAAGRPMPASPLIPPAPVPLASQPLSVPPLPPIPNAFAPSPARAAAEQDFKEKFDLARDRVISSNYVPQLRHDALNTCGEILAQCAAKIKAKVPEHAALRDWAINKQGPFVELVRSAKRVAMENPTAWQAALERLVASLFELAEVLEDKAPKLIQDVIEAME